jgi:hypothetical protein
VTTWEIIAVSVTEHYDYTICHSDIAKADPADISQVNGSSLIWLAAMSIRVVTARVIQIDSS